MDLGQARPDLLPAISGASSSIEVLSSALVGASDELILCLLMSWFAGLSSGNFFFARYWHYGLSDNVYTNTANIFQGNHHSGGLVEFQGKPYVSLAE